VKRNIIGITGGIGSGKSTAARILGNLGAYVLDADEISRHALDMGTDCYRAVADWVGDAVLLPDQSIDRRALAELVFSDEAARQRLNAIVHPYVLRVMEERTDEILNRDPAACVVWDVPLLLESGYERHVGCVVLITAPAELRLNRIPLPREEALRRMGAQWTDEKKARLADYVLPNEGTAEAFETVVRAFYRDWSARTLCRPECGDPTVSS